MICDKCGFEHNSRSECPKCGARVVFVNEDYLRRKKQWEEAQKSGKEEGSLPPGIMYSTREDYDRRHGLDTVTIDNERERHERHTKKGGPETAGLSSAVVQEHILKAVSAVAGFFREHNFFKRFKRKHGNNNPVIRELKFDDQPENLDNSKLVVSHRIFKDKRPKFLIIGGVVIAAAVIAVTAFNIIKNTDRSRVFYFDGKYGYYSDNADEPLFGNIGGAVTFTEIAENTFLAYDSAGLYICRDGKSITIGTDKPVPVAYNDALSIVIFVSDGETIVTDGENTAILDIDMEQGYTGACAVSDNGKYFVLTTCSASDDFSSGEYTMYFGEYGGELQQVVRDYNDKDIVRVDNDGNVLYLDMATADYGIINGRSLVEYGKENTRVVAEGISEYRIIGEYMYYLTGEDKLYAVNTDNVGAPMLIDSQVVELSDNAVSDEDILLYRSDNGYFAGENNGEITALFASKDAVADVYYTGGSYLYYSYMNELYFVAQTGASAVGEKLFGLKESDSVIFYSGDECFIALDTDGNLHRLAGDNSDDILANGADRLISVENYNGFMYTAGMELFVIKDTGKKPEKAGEIPDGVSKAVYSRKYFYCINDKNILYKMGRNGKDVENLGYAVYLTVTVR